MAKQSGLGWTTCTLGDGTNTAQAIINDVTDLQFATPRAVQDITGINKSAFEKLLLLADFTASLKGVFNPGVQPSAHMTLATVPSTSINRTLTLVVGGKTLAPNVIVTDYQLARATSGEFTWTAPMMLADGAVPTWS